MIAAKLPLGDSFEQRIAYLFGDGRDPGRALFAVAEHLASEPRHASAEMDDTWRNQARLKRASGLPAGGRRCTKPVRHDVLSWHREECPSATKMIAAARSYLAAIGLDRHEAVIVGHDHNGKRHVHIVANTVNPVTGRVADMTGDHHKAQAWCLAYEHAQGRIRCKHRTAPDMAGAISAATGKTHSRQRPSRPEWERRQKRKAADQEARARHSAAAWAKLAEQLRTEAANAPTKQKASTQPALRP